MKNIICSLKIFFTLTIITGIIYPLAVTLFAQVIFPYQANGSLITENNQILGSELLAQKFISEKYFWPRPSASDYAAVPSGASNLSPTSQKLKIAVEQRAEEFRRANQLKEDVIIPSEMLFASASGLDPDISETAVELQMPRVIRSRELDRRQQVALAKLVKEYTEDRQYGIFGEPKVNILKLNIALDQL